MLLLNCQNQSKSCLSFILLLFLKKQLQLFCHIVRYQLFSALYIVCEIDFWGEKKRQIVAINNSNNKSINCILYFHKQHNVLLITALFIGLRRERQLLRVSKEAQSPTEQPVVQLLVHWRAAFWQGGCTAQSWPDLQSKPGRWCYGREEQWGQLQCPGCEEASTPEAALSQRPPKLGTHLRSLCTATELCASDLCCMHGVGTPTLCSGSFQPHKGIAAAARGQKVALRWGPTNVFSYETVPTSHNNYNYTWKVLRNCNVEYLTLKIA